MRFCPFCSVENSEGALYCGACARKLPPVPPRQKNRSTGPSITLAEETETNRTAAQQLSGDVAKSGVAKDVQHGDLTVHQGLRKPSTSVRLPVPARVERDRAAEKRPKRNDKSKGTSSDVGQPLRTQPNVEEGATAKPTVDRESQNKKAAATAEAAIAAMASRKALAKKALAAKDALVAMAARKASATQSPQPIASPMSTSSPDIADIHRTIENTPTPVQATPAPTPIQTTPAPAPVQTTPAPTPIQTTPAPMPVQATSAVKKSLDADDWVLAAEVPAPTVHSEPTQPLTTNTTASIVAEPSGELQSPSPSPSPIVPVQENEDISNDWVNTSDGFVTPPTQTSLGNPLKTTKVDPVPEIPDGGLWPQIRYVIHFVRGRWQRRTAIKSLKEQIVEDTSALDAELGQLGGQVRALGLTNRTLEVENTAIDEAEQRKAIAEREHSTMIHRQAEENSRFAEIETDRKGKVAEAESALLQAKQEQGSLDAQRRGLRAKRKDVERQQKGLIAGAEEREGDAEKMDMGDERMSLRRAAEGLRKQASNLHPALQDIQRRLETLERPMSQAMAKVEALKGELESAKRSLTDAREGHGHRQSEIDAELKSKSRDLAQAEAEIKRRLVTVGTIVNLHRIDRDEFAEIYGKIDTLRGAIGSRTAEIDRLSAERDAYDKRSLTRGGLIFAGLFLALCLVIAILIWAL